MWRPEDLKTWRSAGVRMWGPENLKMWRSAGLKICGRADVKTRRSQDAKICKREDVKTWRSQDAKICRREDAKTRRRTREWPYLFIKYKSCKVTHFFWTFFTLSHEMDVKRQTLKAALYTSISWRFFIATFDYRRVINDTPLLRLIQLVSIPIHGLQVGLKIGYPPNPMVYQHFPMVNMCLNCHLQGI